MSLNSEGLAPYFLPFPQPMYNASHSEIESGGGYPGDGGCYYIDSPQISISEHAIYIINAPQANNPDAKAYHITIPHTHLMDLKFLPQKFLSSAQVNAAIKPLPALNGFGTLKLKFGRNSTDAERFYNDLLTIRSRTQGDSIDEAVPVYTVDAQPTSSRASVSQPAVSSAPLIYPSEKGSTPSVSSRVPNYQAGTTAALPSIASASQPPARDLEFPPKGSPPPYMG